MIGDPDLSVGSLNDDDSEPPMVCPVTGSYCEGDLSHLCLDYGCARQCGESPHSESSDPPTILNIGRAKRRRN